MKINRIFGVILRKVALFCSAALILHAIPTKRLQRIQTTQRVSHEEAPLSWQSPGVKNYLGSRTVISHKQLTQQANQSVEEALQNVPGVHIRNFSGTGAMPSFSIRGFGGGSPGHSNTGLVLVNGIPIYVAPYALIGISIFPVTFQSVDRISVTKGGESVRYGPNAFGGVINIITKPIPTKWSNQIAERTTFWGRSNGGFITSNNGAPNHSLGNNFLYNTYLKTGGMFNKYVGIQAQVNYITGKGFRYNSPTTIQNYMFDGIYQINESNKITAYYQYYKFFLTDPGSLAPSAYNEDRFQNNRPHNTKSGAADRWGVVYQNFFGDESKIGGDFTLTYYGHSMSRDFQFDSNYLNVNTNPSRGLVYTNDNYPGFFIVNHARHFFLNAIEPNVNLHIATKHLTQHINFGLRFMANDIVMAPMQSTCKTLINGKCQMPQATPLLKSSQDMDNNYTALYLSDKFEFFKGKFVLAPGLRYTFLNYDRKVPIKPDYTTMQTLKTHLSEWSPALNIGYKPLEGLLFYGNYRRSFIPPQNRMIALYSSNYNQLFDEMEFGGRYSYKDKLSFNANYFLIFAKNYYSGGYSPGPVDARSQGVELELYYSPIRGLNLHAAYTYINATVTNDALDETKWFEGIVDHPFNIKGKQLPYVSPHQFILGATYTYKYTTIGLSSYFYSHAFSSMLNQVRSQTACFPLSGAKTGGVSYGCNSVGLLPWYWVWNIQISQVFWKSGRHRIVGSLQVNNIFDMKYYFRGIGTSPTGRQPAPGRSVTAYLSYEF
ncbi:TonB-dependent receptor family protein [Helicobacter heilmannii]|uniref:TonB-dependent receptor family protein n=1 Tax=Helicobacter heilmannii TaxID=35817 RepID=UPI001F25A5EC|nr:TonB-dependent receptor family protein [Helicobacter heilmannii]